MATPIVHICPVPGCKAVVMPTKLLCLPHWMLVPQPLQLTVYRCWATLRKARKPNLVMAATRAYRKARQAAIDAVVAVEKSA